MATNVTASRKLATLGELKAELAHRYCTLYVWVPWEAAGPDGRAADGEYVMMPRSWFLRGIGADTPNDGAHGGRHDHTPVIARVDIEGSGRRDVYVG